jgi:YD repeat-containing protein
MSMSSLLCGRCAQGPSATRAGGFGHSRSSRVVLQERDGGDVPQVTYTRGTDLSGTFQGAGGIAGLLARSDSSVSLYYHADASGNVTELVDANGNEVAHYRYDPFGRILAMTGPDAGKNL